MKKKIFIVFLLLVLGAWSMVHNPSPAFAAPPVSNPELAACQAKLNKANLDQAACQDKLNKISLDNSNLKRDLQTAQQNLQSCRSEPKGCFHIRLGMMLWPANQPRLYFPINFEVADGNQVAYSGRATAISFNGHLYTLYSYDDEINSVERNPSRFVYLQDFPLAEAKLYLGSPSAGGNATAASRSNPTFLTFVSRNERGGWSTWAFAKMSDADQQRYLADHASGAEDMRYLANRNIDPRDRYELSGLNCSD